MTRLPEQPGVPRSMLQSRTSARSSGEVASPHRAGHYSGLHPEDQPYQSDDVHDPRRAPRQHGPIPVDDEFEEEEEDEMDPGYTDKYVEQHDIDTGYDDPPRMANSVRRYAPVQPASPRTVMRVQQYSSAIPPRASRTQTQDYRPPKPEPVQPGTRRPQPEPEPRRRRERSGPRLHWLVYVGGAMLLMMLGWMTLSEVATWWQTTQDTWHYGYPRTFQMDVVVGHSDSAAHPSHFIALNLRGQVEVIEFPGGDAAKAKIYLGPDLIGPGQDLAPVTLSFQETGGNGKPEMMVTVGTAHYTYHNTGRTFVPPKP